jgi:hypothetical protein
VQPGLSLGDRFTVAKLAQDGRAAAAANGASASRQRDPALAGLTPRSSPSGSRGGATSSGSPSRGAGGSGGSSGTVVPDETVDYGDFLGNPPAAVATDSPGGSALPRSTFSERSPAAAALAVARAKERNRPNLAELPGHTVDLNGKVLDAQPGVPRFPLMPEFASISFQTQDRDPTADNRRDVTGAPVSGPAYRVTGTWTNAFGQEGKFEGYMVDMPGGFSWLFLYTSTDGGAPTRFMGYISDGGLVAGRMWSYALDSSGGLLDWALTSESGQW